MSDNVKPLPHSAPSRKKEADDLDLEAACQLTCAKAIADLVQTLADHELLDSLTKHTVSVAMDDIRRHIDMAEVHYRQVWALSWGKEMVQQ